MNYLQHLAVFHLAVVKEVVASERKARFAAIDTLITPAGKGNAHLAQRAVAKAKAEAGFQARIFEAENAIVLAAA